MASDNTDKAMLALTTFSDTLHEVAATEAQQLDGLMRKLRVAAQNERAFAVQQLGEKSTWLETANAACDAANAKVQASSLELEMAQDELVKLRQEVTHLEGEIKKAKGRIRETERVESAPARRSDRGGGMQPFSVSTQRSMTNM